MVTDEQSRYLIQVRDKVRACTNCELHEKATKPVAASGPLPCKYIVLGEAPGKIEDYKGVPFIGPAGRTLRSLLNEYRLEPEKAMYMNIVSCWPQGAPEPKHIKACRWNLVAQLMAACNDLVLVCGKPALQALVPHAELKWSQGSLIPIHGFRCMIMWHPSFLLRTKSKTVEKDMRETLQVFKAIVSGVLPSDWARNNWCIYCGSTALMGDSPACLKHQGYWRSDQQWQKPIQGKLL